MSEEKQDRPFETRESFTKFARRVLEKQHVSDQLKKARLRTFDELIKQGYEVGECYEAANQIVHIR